MHETYLVATKLNGRSFITGDLPKNFEEAKSLAKRLAGDSLWQGSEIVILWDNIEIKRMETKLKNYKKKKS
jgi:hypothetical protein